MPYFVYILESVLSSSIIVVSFTGIINAGLVWYGSVVGPIELLGPTRFHWDNSYFAQELYRRVKSTSSYSSSLSSSWCSVNDKLLLYDYVGSNPSKGGIFRSGPIIKGDGVVQNWIGHPSFSIGKLAVSVRRIPSFFETFPLLFIDQRGRLRADVPFRRAQSSFSIEQATNLLLSFYGGILSGREYSSASIIKGYGLKSQLGEIFYFDKSASTADGVFRTSHRGWFSFGHTSLALLFLFGHIWHGGRSLFEDLSAGITNAEVARRVEYGLNESLGDGSADRLY